MQPQVLIHVGPPPSGHGGISVVIRRLVEVQRQDPSLDVHTLPTTREGGTLRKLAAGVASTQWMLANRTLVRGGTLHLHAAIRLSFFRKAALLRLGRLLGAKTVLHLHGSHTLEWYRASSPRVQRMIRGHLDAADHLVSVNKQWTEDYKALSSTPVSYVYNALDVGKFQLRNDVRTEPPYTLLYLGRIDDAKGSWHLLEAFGQLVAENRDVRLVLAGNGEVARARSWLQSHNLAQRSEVPGWIGPDAVRDLLAKADILVLPSVAHESFGLVLIEAMATGLPVVASRVGGIPEVVVDGETGRLVPAADATALKTALGELLDDPPRRLEMGLAGRKRVETTFDLPAAALKLREIYASLGV